MTPGEAERPHGSPPSATPTCTRPLPVAASVAALTASALRNTAAVMDERSWLLIRAWR